MISQCCDLIKQRKAESIQAISSRALNINELASRLLIQLNPILNKVNLLDRGSKRALFFLLPKKIAQQLQLYF